MKQLPAYLLSDLIRHFSVLVENVDIKDKSTRVVNAVRLAKNDLKKLERLKDK